MLTHRYTRNSRGPGQDGIPVVIAPGRAVTCPKCHRVRLSGEGPHAPRLTSRGRVDCVGDVIVPIVSHTEVVNLRSSEFDVYIGRAGKGWDGYFGNPFTLREHGYRALDLFRTYFLERVERDRQFRDRVLELRGKRLGCFCAPAPCHGDLIAAWIDGRSR